MRPVRQRVGEDRLMETEQTAGDVPIGFDELLELVAGCLDDDPSGGGIIRVLDRYRPVVAGGFVGLLCTREHDGGGDPAVLILTHPDDDSEDTFLGISVSQRTVTLADLVEQALTHEGGEHAGPDSDVLNSCVSPR